jgi:hypothetical protein
MRALDGKRGEVELVVDGCEHSFEGITDHAS